MQARPFVSSSTAASNSGVKITSRHQHGLLKPHDAATAQSFTARKTGRADSAKAVEGGAGPSRDQIYHQTAPLPTP